MKLNQNVKIATALTKYPPYYVSERLLIYILFYALSAKLALFLLDLREPLLSSLLFLL